MKTCPNCQAKTNADLICRACGSFLPRPESNLVAASLWRRFFAHLLDGLILPVVTLLIGWLIWFYFTAKNGQTPGKKLLGIRVVRADGAAVTARRMWGREVGYWILAGAVSFTLVANVVLLYWDVTVFWDKNKQRGADRWLKTLVVNAPVPEEDDHASVGSEELISAPAARSIQPQSDISSSTVEEELRRLAKLHDDKLLTDDEFEEKRRTLVDKL